MKKPFECRIDRFSLHYEERMNDVEATSKALDGFVETTKLLEVGGEKVFRSVNDTVGVIDFEFTEAVELKDFRKWCEWLEMTFMSILEPN